MFTHIVALFIVVFTVTYGQVLIYDTENEVAIEKFDCVYYLYDDGEEIPYCRRPGTSESINRDMNGCDNQGEKLLFRYLLDREISPSNILKWSSSVEMVDLYAGVFDNRSLIEDDDNNQFLCNCTKPGTFGKYCEYQLTHGAKTFTDAIQAQFEQKKNGDSWNTQRYGNILCYETLPCFRSPLCLDWREICDGIQRCPTGLDEENWDKLEFNECEENEFRCTNGMCIAEEFWFDGDYDCMDWSDEYFSNHGQLCPFEPNSMKCDEHLCNRWLYSCGDGQCVDWYIRMAFQRIAGADDDCFSKRNLNYMCEVSHHKRAWTLNDGLCWPDKDYDDPRYPPWNMIHASNLSREEKCRYLFRCAWSNGFERDCPCDHQNCTPMMMSVCSGYDQLVEYPPGGLINPNFHIFYNYSQPVESSNFHLFTLFGGLKCRGFFYEAKMVHKIVIAPLLMESPLMNHALCVNEDPKAGYRNFLVDFKNDQFCWNDSLTFNGRPYAVNPDICIFAGECISQYRIRDGTQDCFIINEDEEPVLEENSCTGHAERQRFQCFNDEHKCLPLSQLGTGDVGCSNYYDESWHGTSAIASLRQEIPCFKDNTAGCQRIKAYVQQSSARNASNNNSLVNPQQHESKKYLSFRSYCNTFWDLDQHIDEISSSCKHWVCQHEEYQCQTGQCISIDWVCDGEWDCPDASDEEAIVIIKNWSDHNIGLRKLPSQLEKCRQLYFSSPFSQICNTSFEFGCYRSGVSNPSDIKLNRPCINLTQIGDGVEDCYNAYDEKNTFTTNSILKEMWGFHAHCGSSEQEYLSTCNGMFSCTNILCSNYRDKNRTCLNFKDFICLEDDYCKINIRCNKISDCPNGEDEYWCPSGSLTNQKQYRSVKTQILLHQLNSLSPIWYPYDSMQESNQQQLSNSINNLGNDPFFKMHSYRCNRGVAILQMEEIRCLCPPAYYGSRCEFYSDRISIIAHFDQINFLNTKSNITFKIRASFLFNNMTIDHHEFNIVPIFEQAKIIKHRFYFLYLLSREMIRHKRWRYLNRTDLINNHPYSVHFDVFALEENYIIEELGSWHYPIYFDYLPAFRLAVILKFPSWFGNVTLNPCRQNSCHENSICLPIFNQNNASYCSCRSGYYGPNCSIYERLCETHCSANALCRFKNYNPQVKINKLYCICPLDHFGPRCNLKYDDCDSNPCLHNGNCLPKYDLSGEMSYKCNCSERFHGKQCQNEKTSVRIDLNLTGALAAHATVVQLYDFDLIDFALHIRHQQIHYVLPSTISYYDSSAYAPLLGVLKIYDDLSHPQYFITYFLNQSVINITSSPQNCPHALSLLSEGTGTDKTVPAVFKYHEICQNHTELLCFYDENYLCLCQSNHSRVDCLIHDPQLDHCDKCLSGGKCLQGNPKDSNEFICLCPTCHQGYQCEFSIEAFGFTLDSLLVDYSNKVKIAYMSVACLLFLVGFFTNLCSFVTFKRPTPRKFGAGNYLFIVTCFNQVVLLCLFVKFIQITFVTSNVNLCKAISYLLSVFTRSIFWLTSWITIDRLLVLLFPTSIILKNSRLAIGMSIATSIILLVIHVHEIIHYTVIQHYSTDSSICVTNFDTSLVSTYNRVSTLVHYLCPFFIQVISITVLIVLAARSRVKVAGKKMTFGQVLKKQFQTQKELYTTPTIIVLSALPQAILTFSFACTQMADWQRHTLLGSYLLSYAPQVLGFLLYVIPSTGYKKEFSETSLSQTLFKWMSDKKKDGVALRR